jgi:hypothetical protein
MRKKMEIELVVDQKVVRDLYLDSYNVFDHHLKKMLVIDVGMVVVIIMMENPSIEEEKRKEI